MFDGNVSGDMKLKPLLVYHSENPRALKHTAKGSLPIVCKSNVKAWVTQAIFQDWFFHYFIPEVEKYHLEKVVSFNILLLLDTTLDHPPFMDDFHPNVNVVYLPQILHSSSNLWTRESLQLSRNSIQVTLFCQPVKASDESGTIL